MKAYIQHWSIASREELVAKWADDGYDVEAPEYYAIPNQGEKRFVDDALGFEIDWE
ncbi:hypothetical protein DSL72_005910 [Monilinia vaccinii-corymbosi]|uniref:Uncharacterized protein n=1 Tax=Monilinia vaccinii-corymbosi TaxID=61207 RepID=A0A8A3PH09_9HELO|nr:hypothetical protein DSL72_005910 [Monilinia vaccinii-corymbosi]